MNKLHFVVLFFSVPFWMHASSKDSIEEAIQESDIKTVRLCLQHENSLFYYDKQSLLDLAQGVIKKRHAEWKAHVGFRGLSLHEGLLFFIALALIKKSSDPGLIGLWGVVLSVPFVVVKRIKSYNEYTNLYNNALQIKRLIQESDFARPSLQRQR